MAMLAAAPQSAESYVATVSAARWQAAVEEPRAEPGALSTGTLLVSPTPRTPGVRIVIVQTDRSSDEYCVSAMPSWVDHGSAASQAA